MTRRRAKPEMLRRQRAVEATKAKYKGRIFDWKAKATCLHMTNFLLRRMGRRPPRMPQVGSLLAAKRELAKRGWSTVADMLDGIGLERIAPAFLRLGDLIVDASGDGLGAIYIATGDGNAFGWAAEMPELAVITVTNPDGVLGAWRV